MSAAIPVTELVDFDQIEAIAACARPATPSPPVVIGAGIEFTRPTEEALRRQVNVVTLIDTDASPG